MQIIQMDINLLKEYENNPRINDNAVDAVAQSIKEFGFKVPIVVDKDNVIITGHTRLFASYQLGLSTVPVIRADDLSEEQIKAFRIADNKTGELADWDIGLLEEEIASILDIDVTKFGFELPEEVEIGDGIEDEEKGMVPFTEELGEESNYIVLKFDTAVDWLQVESLFKLKPVKALDSKVGYERIGTGRVVDGVKFLNEIMGDDYDLF